MSLCILGVSQNLPFVALCSGELFLGVIEMARSSPPRGKKKSSFRIGNVHAFLRECIWCLRYFEGGKRHLPRVGPDREAAAQMAAEINAQVEVGASSSLDSFQSAFRNFEIAGCNIMKTSAALRWRSFGHCLFSTYDPTYSQMRDNA